MRRGLIKTAVLFVAILALLLSLWGSISLWLPIVSGYWLPSGWSISIDKPPRLSRTDSQWGKLVLANKTHQQTAVVISGLTIDWQHQPLSVYVEHIELDDLALQSMLDALPARSDDTDSSSLSLSSLQHQLPQFVASIAVFEPTHFPDFAGRLTFENSLEQQTLHYKTANLTAQLALEQEQLTIKADYLGEETKAFHLSGTIELAEMLTQLPLHAQFAATYQQEDLASPVNATLVWADNHGELQLRSTSEQTLATLPWQLIVDEQSGDVTQLRIEQATWDFNAIGYPLSGGMALALYDWDTLSKAATLDAKVNMLTAGYGGQANVVMSIDGQRLQEKDNQIPFQLTGKANTKTGSVYLTIPGQVSRDLLNPIISFLPGSLLRMTGALTPEIKLNEIRFPLAGVSLSREGLNGPLEAIASGTHQQWGPFKLHLDGRATDFLFNQGEWQWRFWGNGQLPEFKGRWQVAGKGDWHNEQITIAELTSSVDQLIYGRSKLKQASLALTTPLQWQRGENPRYQADWQLHADKLTFAHGGYLDKPSVNFLQKGTAPNDFIWYGQFTSGPIGPIKSNGRWDGERLRGEVNWSQQPLTVLQSLLTESAGNKISGGTIRAQAAFSAAPEQGLIAGGHVVVNNGRMWLKEGELDGLEFISSYRLANHIWQLGDKQPISLSIKKVDSLFPLTKIRAKLQGAYPPSQRRPLVLSGVSVEMLDGKVMLDELRIPQRGASTLKVKSVEVSQLLTALKASQFAMSGPVSGELPFYLTDKEWLIKGGWIENDKDLTLRLDQQFVDAIEKDDMVAGAAMDWLRYVEISRSRADINVTNLGLLTMDIQIKGVNSVKSKERPVVLNYHHEENIYDLWRSLRFGDNLQDWIEQQLSQGYKETE